MQKKIFRLSLCIVAVGIFSSLSGCNLYAPFTTDYNTDDYLEQAQVCLKKNDVACAIAQYQMLPAGDQKNEKLCVSYLSQAGFTTLTLLNVVTQGGNTMLGGLANALLPWSQTKSGAIANAITTCGLVQDKTGVLLTALSLLVDCALRISKTDQFVGSSDTDTVCTTPGNNDGQITKADIGNAGSGDAGPGMCFADVTACATDITQMSAPQLQNAGLSSIASAIQQIPAALSNSSVACDVGRQAIQSTLAN